MKKYVGTKVILAEPMDECLFLKSVKGQDVSDRETRPGYKVQYEDGYISWSPSDVFERCYREITDQEINMIIGNDLPVKNY
jgi:hypothetical protein